MYEVILYYNFTPVEDPETFCKKHKKWLKKSGLKGRVYISKEGINGTLGGTPEQIQNYRNYLWGIDGFENSEFKTDEHDAIPFAKLVCKVRDEIVAIYEEGLDPKEGGRYLPPSEWKKMMESGEDYVMIDVRNNYESKVGHFEGAITPNVENFYDFPKWLEEAEEIALRLRAGSLDNRKPGEECRTEP